MGNFSKYGNIMVDLETLSTKTNASIIEIGVVEFNKYSGEIGDKLSIIIHPNDWSKNGRDVDGNTVVWWFGQCDEARKRYIDNVGINLFEGLTLLKNFIKECDNKDNNAKERVVLWGNGSTMDITILQSAFEHFNIELPWKYWAVNDVRTIVDLKPEIKHNFEFKGTKHSAVDDCIHQIGYLTETIKSLNVSQCGKKDNTPFYLRITIPEDCYEVDCVDFPLKNKTNVFNDNREKVVYFTIDLVNQKILEWEPNFGDFNFFMKVVDQGKYDLYNENLAKIGSIEGYVPNGVVPPKDGFGDYIEFFIYSNGSVRWYDYDEMDFSNFNLKE